MTYPEPLDPPSITAALAAQGEVKDEEAGERMEEDGRGTEETEDEEPYLAEDEEAAEPTADVEEGPGRGGEQEGGRAEEEKAPSQLPFQPRVTRSVASALAAAPLPGVTVQGAWRYPSGTSWSVWINKRNESFNFRCRDQHLAALASDLVLCWHRECGDGSFKVRFPAKTYNMPQAAYSRDGELLAQLSRISSSGQMLLFLKTVVAQALAQQVQHSRQRAQQHAQQQPEATHQPQTHQQQQQQQQQTEQQQQQEAAAGLASGSHKRKQREPARVVHAHDLAGSGEVGPGRPPEQQEKQAADVQPQEEQQHAQQDAGLQQAQQAQQHGQQDPGQPKREAVALAAARYFEGPRLRPEEPPLAVMCLDLDSGNGISSGSGSSSITSLYLLRAQVLAKAVKEGTSANNFTGLMERCWRPGDPPCFLKATSEAVHMLAAQGLWKAHNRLSWVLLPAAARALRDNRQLSAALGAAIAQLEERGIAGLPQIGLGQQPFQQQPAQQPMQPVRPQQLHVQRELQPNPQLQQQQQQGGSQAARYYEVPPLRPGGPSLATMSLSHSGGSSSSSSATALYLLRTQVLAEFAQAGLPTTNFTAMTERHCRDDEPDWTVPVALDVVRALAARGFVAPLASKLRWVLLPAIARRLRERGCMGSALGAALAQLEERGTKGLAQLDLRQPGPAAAAAVGPAAGPAAAAAAAVGPAAGPAAAAAAAAEAEPVLAALPSGPGVRTQQDAISQGQEETQELGPRRYHQGPQLAAGSASLVVMATGYRSGSSGACEPIYIPRATVLEELGRMGYSCSSFTVFVERRWRTGEPPCFLAASYGELRLMKARGCVARGAKCANWVFLPALVRALQQKLGEGGALLAVLQQLEAGGMRGLPALSLAQTGPAAQPGEAAAQAAGAAGSSVPGSPELAGLAASAQQRQQQQQGQQQQGQQQQQQEAQQRAQQAKQQQQQQEAQQRAQQAKQQQQQQVSGHARAPHTPALPELAAAELQASLQRAVAAFERADRGSAGSMRQALLHLALADLGGDTLQTLLDRWTGLPLAAQQAAFTAALVVTERGAWQRLEARLQMALDSAGVQ